MAKKKPPEVGGHPPAGEYSNFLRIAISLEDFVWDFGQKITDTDIVQFHTRIITSPQHALQMYELIGRVLEKYKQKTIGEPPQGEPPPRRP